MATNTKVTEIKVLIAELEAIGISSKEINAIIKDLAKIEKKRNEEISKYMKLLESIANQQKKIQELGISQNTISKETNETLADYKARLVEVFNLIEKITEATKVKKTEASVAGSSEIGELNLQKSEADGQKVLGQIRRLAELIKIESKETLDKMAGFFASELKRLAFKIGHEQMSRDLLHRMLGMPTDAETEVARSAHRVRTDQTTTQLQASFEKQRHTLEQLQTSGKPLVTNIVDVAKLTSDFDRIAKEAAELKEKIAGMAIRSEGLSRPEDATAKAKLDKEIEAEVLKYRELLGQSKSINAAREQRVKLEIQIVEKAKLLSAIGGKQINVEESLLKRKGESTLQTELHLKNLSKQVTYQENINKYEKEGADLINTQVNGLIRKQEALVYQLKIKEDLFNKEKASVGIATKDIAPTKTLNKVFEESAENVKKLTAELTIAKAKLDTKTTFGENTDNETIKVNQLNDALNVEYGRLNAVNTQITEEASLKVKVVELNTRLIQLGLESKDVTNLTIAQQKEFVEQSTRKIKTAEALKEIESEILRLQSQGAVYEESSNARDIKSIEIAKEYRNILKERAVIEAKLDAYAGRKTKLNIAEINRLKEIRKITADVAIKRKMISILEGRSPSMLEKIRDKHKSIMMIMGQRLRFIATAGLAYKLQNSFIDMFKKSLTETLKLEKEIAEVGTLQTENLLEMNALLKSYKDTIMELSESYGEDTGKLAKALYDIRSATIQSSKALEVLEVVTRAGKASLTDAATATKPIIAILNAYKLEASEAEYVSDMLFATIQRGVTTMKELAPNIGKAIAAAAMVGVDAAQVLAMVSSTTRMGVSTRETITAINRLMLNFSKQTTAASKIALKYGFDLDTISESKNGLVEVFYKMQDATDQEKIALVGSVRAFKAMAAGVIDVKGQMYDLNYIREAAGLTDVAMDKIRDTVSFKTEQITQTIHNAMLKFGELLLPVFDNILTMFDTLQSSGIMDWMEKITVAVTFMLGAFAGYEIASLAIMLVTKLIQGYSTLTQIIGLVTGKTVVNTVALNANTAAYTGVGGAAIVAANGVGVYGIATTAATKSTLGLGASIKLVTGSAAGLIGLLTIVASIGVAIWASNSARSKFNSLHAQQNALLEKNKKLLIELKNIEDAKIDNEKVLSLKRLVDQHTELNESMDDSLDKEEKLKSSYEKISKAAKDAGIDISKYGKELKDSKALSDYLADKNEEDAEWITGLSKNMIDKQVTTMKKDLPGQVAEMKKELLSTIPSLMGTFDYGNVTQQSLTNEIKKLEELKEAGGKIMTSGGEYILSDDVIDESIARIKAFTGTWDKETQKWINLPKLGEVLEAFEFDTSDTENLQKNVSSITDAVKKLGAEAGLYEIDSVLFEIENKARVTFKTFDKVSKIFKTITKQQKDINQSLLDEGDDEANFKAKQKLVDKKITDLKKLNETFKDTQTAKENVALAKLDKEFEKALTSYTFKMVDGKRKATGDEEVWSKEDLARVQKELDALENANEIKAQIITDEFALVKLVADAKHIENAYQLGFVEELSTVQDVLNKKTEAEIALLIKKEKISETEAAILRRNNEIKIAQIELNEKNIKAQIEESKFEFGKSTAQSVYSVKFKALTAETELLKKQGKYEEEIYLYKLNQLDIEKENSILSQQENLLNMEKSLYELSATKDLETIRTKLQNIVDQKIIILTKENKLTEAQVILQRQIFEYENERYLIQENIKNLQKEFEYGQKLETLNKKDILALIKEIVDEEAKLQNFVVGSAEEEHYKKMLTLEKQRQTNILLTIEQIKLLSKEMSIAEDEAKQTQFEGIMAGVGENAPTSGRFVRGLSDEDLHDTIDYYNNVIKGSKDLTEAEKEAYGERVDLLKKEIIKRSAFAIFGIEMYQTKADARVAMEQKVAELISQSMDWLFQQKLADIEKQKEADLDYVDSKLASDKKIVANSLITAAHASRVFAAMDSKAAKEKEAIEEKADKDRANAEKKQARATVYIDLAKGIFGIWATALAENPIFGSGVALAMSALLAGMAAAQIGMINGTQFAEGGYTGFGNERDNTGERKAGIVHEKEFVFKRAATEGNVELFYAMQDALASGRTFTGFATDYLTGSLKYGSLPRPSNSFADGGYTGNQVESSYSNDINELLSIQNELISQMNIKLTAIEYHNNEVSYNTDKIRKKGNNI